jgi:hypothetical protein
LPAWWRDAGFPARASAAGTASAATASTAATARDARVGFKLFPLREDVDAMARIVPVTLHPRQDFLATAGETMTASGERD